MYLNLNIWVKVLPSALYCFSPKKDSFKKSTSTQHSKITNSAAKKGLLGRSNLYNSIATNTLVFDSAAFLPKEPGELPPGFVGSVTNPVDVPVPLGTASNERHACRICLEGLGQKRANLVVCWVYI